MSDFKNSKFGILRTSIPIPWTSVTSRATSRAQDDVTQRHDVIQATISLLSHGCQAVARGALSSKPLGRFRSFFACRLVWWSRVHQEKFSTIGPISQLWENYLISMVTDWNLRIPISRRYFRGSIDCPCAIWSRSVENPGSRSRTNKRTANSNYSKIFNRIIFYLLLRKNVFLVGVFYFIF